MIESCAWEKGQNNDLSGSWWISTLTYRGGEASLGRETADQEQDGEAGAGATDDWPRNIHPSDHHNQFNMLLEKLKL